MSTGFGTMESHDEPEPSLDEVITEEVSDAGDATRVRSVRRAVHTWLSFHSGLLGEFGIGHDEVDAVAVASAQRLSDEGHYRWDSAFSSRERAGFSLRTQLGNEITPNPVSLDVEAIAMGYNLPGISPIDETLLTVFHTRFPGDVGYSYNSWNEFTTVYRSLSSYLVYDLDLVLAAFEDLLPAYMREVDYDWNARMENRHYRNPSIQVIGVHSDRDHSVGAAATSRELGRLVRVHGQITLLSASKTQFIEAAYKCSRCEDAEIEIVHQHLYDDEMMFPMPCTVHGNTGWSLLEPPESRAITIRRALIQDPMTTNGDTPVMMVEFQQELSESIGPGEEVILVGYIRSRPMNKTSRRDRNRDVFMVVTGIESNSVQADISVTDAERAEVIAWADSRPFSERLEELTTSFAPHIIGRDEVKQALILQALGGSHHAARYDIHVALFGDPGTGKTELARAAFNNHPGSRYISAERATIPGMIGGVSHKEEMFSSGDKRVIEPGVLASVAPGGIAVIDEAHFLDSRGKELSTQLNTALETQEVPISLIGGGKVRTKTPVLFAANPKKGNNTRFDPSSGLSYAQQAGLAESTMSRIDVIMVMRDTLKDDAHEVARSNSALMNLTGRFDTSQPDARLSLRFLQCFFAIARETTHVDIPMDMIQYISEDQLKRRKESSSASMVSNRRINSIGRFACAAAKITFSETVTKEHADFAIELVSKSLIDTEPGAAEGGNTNAQAENRKLVEECFEALQFTYPNTDTFSVADIEKYMNEVKKPLPRNTIADIMKKLAGDNTYVTGAGTMVRRGQKYGFQ